MPRIYKKTGKYSTAKPTSTVSTFMTIEEPSSKNTGYTKEEMRKIMRKPIDRKTMQAYYMGVDNKTN